MIFPPVSVHLSCGKNSHDTKSVGNDSEDEGTVSAITRTAEITLVFCLLSGQMGIG